MGDLYSQCSLPSFLQKGTVCSSVVEDHNQNIEIDANKIQTISVIKRITHVAFLRPHPLPFSLSPWYLATSLLLSISLILFIYWKSYQWTIEYVTFWRIFFFFRTQHNSLEIIQLTEFTISSFHFIARWSSRIYIYHRLFNSLLVEGHLGCFSLVTSTNKSAINTYVQVFVWKMFSFLWDKCVWNAQNFNSLKEMCQFFENHKLLRHNKDKLEK